MTREEAELAKLAELACDEARRCGAAAAAARAVQSQRRNVVIRDGLREEIKSATSRAIELRLFVKGRYGEHSTSALDEGSLKAFIARAAEMTAVLMPDPHRALPDPKLYEGRSDGDLRLHDPSRAKLTMAERIQLATAAHDAARAGAGDKLLSAGAGMSDEEKLLVMRSTNGFAGSKQTTSFWVWATVSVKDPRGTRPSDWAEAGARLHGDLPDPKQVGAEAAQRTVAAIGAAKLPSTTLPLIVESRAAGGLLGGLLAPLSGWALDQKQSCFENSIGEPIAAEIFDIVDDPLLAGGWGSRHFDGEGLALRPRPLIERGVLRRFYIDTYYGKKLKREPTSGGATNLVFKPGKRSLDALCKRAGKAVLVTDFLGGNSNSTTGDFSHGISGFLIENGVRKQPIASMNIAGNHTRFWKTVQALGNDPYAYAARRTPSLFFAPLLIAGK